MNFNAHKTLNEKQVHDQQLSTNVQLELLSACTNVSALVWLSIFFRLLCMWNLKHTIQSPSSILCHITIYCILWTENTVNWYTPGFKTAVTVKSFEFVVWSHFREFCECFYPCMTAFLQYTCLRLQYKRILMRARWSWLFLDYMNLLKRKNTI